MSPLEGWPDALIGTIPVERPEFDVGFALEPLLHDGVVPLVKAHDELGLVGHD